MPDLLHRTRYGRESALVRGSPCHILPGQRRNRTMRHARKLIFLGGLCLAFVSQSVGAAQGPYLSSLRRLTESQYRNSIADI